jgi:hypothetical protein
LGEAGHAQLIFALLFRIELLLHRAFKLTRRGIRQPALFGPLDIRCIVLLGGLPRAINAASLT